MAPANSARKPWSDSASASPPLCLRLLDGPFAGTSWPISEVPLRIGRGMGCRVRIDDTRVSRLQCEVWLQDGVPRLRNQGQANPTQVNGNLVEEAVLKPGDIVSFAQYHLAIEAGLPSAAEEAGPPTRRFQDTPYHPDTPPSMKRARSLASELLALFNFTKRLGEAISLEQLLQILREHVRQRLAAKQTWLAWPVREGGDITYYPPTGTQDGGEAPLELVREAALNGHGLLRKMRGMMFIAAPLRQSGTVFGVLCAASGRSHSFTEHDLHYLIAVAEATAPHLLAVERLEQYERDAEHLGLRERTHTLIGNSGVMTQLREDLRQAALSRGHVLLLGESGTGKELAARIIHELSTRASGPYVAVNCAALPAELFESEMFGHEKGAFTGALQRRKGLFEEAHGGTLFLDEIGDLSMTSQVRLLRTADNGMIRRI